MSEDEDVPLATDTEIIGWIVSSYLTLLVVVIVLLEAYRNRKKIQQKEIIKPAIISWAGSLIFSITVGFFRSDLIFTSFSFDNKDLCNITYGISAMGWMIMKLSMYFLFLIRLKSVFQGTFRGVKYHSIVAPIIIVMTGIPITFAVSFFLEKVAATTPNGIEFCTVSNNTFTYITIAGLTIFDLIINCYVIGLFCWYFYRILKVIKSGSSDRHELTDKIQHTIRQSVVLVFAASVSTILFIFIGQLYWPIGWFLPLDVMINCLTIYCLFDFAKTTYDLLCCPLDKCCKICCRVDQTVEKSKIESPSPTIPNKQTEHTYETRGISEQFSNLAVNNVAQSEITMSNMER